MVQDQCSFTSTETIRTIRDGAPRTATPIFPQLLSSECSGGSRSMLLYVHRDHNYGLLGTGSRGQPPRLTFSQLLSSHTDIHRYLLLASVALAYQNCLFQCCLTSTETIRFIKDGEPRMAASTFSQLLSSHTDMRRYLLLASVALAYQNCLFQCCLTSTETIRQLGTGSPGRPPRLSHTPEPFLY